MNHFAFLGSPQDLGPAIEAHHDSGLVALSILIAIFSSYTAFLVSGRIREPKKHGHSRVWLVSGAIAMGGGVWAMHFVGMLAYQLPIIVNYNTLTTVVSVFPAIMASFVVLRTTPERNMTGGAILWRSMLMGGGIGLMHYTGMAAMRMDGIMRNDPWLLLGSIVVAVALAGISLRLKLWADQRIVSGGINPTRLLAAAVVMGCAIAGMHYTAMAAMNVFPASAVTIEQMAWPPQVIARVIAAVSILIAVMMVVAIEVSKRMDLYWRIRDSELLQSAILETVGDAIIAVDSKGIIRTFNPAAEKIFGYLAAEVIGSNVSMLLPDQDRKAHEDYTDKSELHAHRILGQDRELKGRRKDGSLFLLELNLGPMELAGERGFVGILRDATEHRLAEKAFLQFKTTLDKTTDGIFMFDPKTLEFYWVNEGATKQVGYNYDELMKMTFFDICPEFNAKNFLDMVKPMIEGKQEMHSIETLHEHKDGHTFPVDVIYQHIIPLGEPGRIVAIVRDITQRKAAEKKLTIYNKQLEVLVEKRTRELTKAQDELMLVIGTLNGYVYRDAINEISEIGIATEIPIYMTDGVEKLSGYPADEFVGNEGRTFPDLILPEDVDAVWKEVREAVSENREYECNYRIRTRNGEARWVHERGYGVYDENGKLQYVEGYIMDDHERKIAETELEKYRDHLEELVAERSKELHDAQDELVRKERLAALGQLTATVSHELRNPLAAMGTSLYIIKKLFDGSTDQRLLNAYDRLDRNIERCDHIVDELLDFTRITNPKMEETLIDKWLQSVIEEMDISKDIQVEIGLCLQDSVYCIDRNRLRRAIINAVDNACQAMQEISGEHRKGSQLSIKTREKDKRVEIVITDTGSGMTEAVLAKIFEPLFSTKSSGIGLGMPTVKQIMEQHGGGIEIDSVEGKGATVTLWLPHRHDGAVAAYSGDKDKGGAVDQKDLT